MSRPLLITTVALASYALFNIILSVVVAGAWRGVMDRGDASRQTTRALLWLRALPALGAVTASLGGVVPAFWLFEPARASEMAGPIVLALAAIGLLQLAASAWIAAATAWRTRMAAREWLRRGEPLDVRPPAGVPAYAIDSLAPIVALVGVFKPRLIAARSVINACTATELNAIVAHERGHLHSRDNLKRWVMACAPDALRWTQVHHEIAARWRNAAEDAADDAATGGDTDSRVDLAALIVKIARLAPRPDWRDATVSAFVEQDSLDRRVRRLLTAASPAQPPTNAAAWTAALAALAAAAVMILQPASLERLYFATEAMIRFGR